MDPLLSLVCHERFDYLSCSSREAVSACNAINSETIGLESELAIFCREGYLPFADTGMGSWVQTTLTPQSGKLRGLVYQSSRYGLGLFSAYEDLAKLKLLKENAALNADRFIHAVRTDVRIIPAVLTVLNNTLVLAVSLATIVSTKTISAKDLQAVMAYTNGVVDIHRLDRDLRDLTGMGFLEGLSSVAESKAIEVAYALRLSSFRKKLSKVLKERSRLQSVALTAYCNCVSLLNILEQLGYVEHPYPSGLFSVVKEQGYTAPNSDLVKTRDVHICTAFSESNHKTVASACYDVGVNVHDLFEELAGKLDDQITSSHNTPKVDFLMSTNYEINSQISDLDSAGNIASLTGVNPGDAVEQLSSPSLSSWTKEQGTRLVREYGPGILDLVVKTGLEMLKKKFMSPGFAANHPSAASHGYNPNLGYQNGSIIPFGGYIN